MSVWTGFGMHSRVRNDDVSPVNEGVSESREGQGLKGEGEGEGERRGRTVSSSCRCPCLDDGCAHARCSSLNLAEGAAGSLFAGPRLDPLSLSLRLPPSLRGEERPVLRLFFSSLLVCCALSASAQLLNLISP